MVENSRFSSRIVILSGIIVFIALQLIILLGSREIYDALNDLEELFAGNLAIDVVSGGPLLPIRNYMIEPLHGGLFLLSLLAIPVFYFIGTSYACLKLTVIIWPTTTFVLLYVLLKLYVDRKAAYIACLLYLLPSANTIYYYSWATITHEYIFTFSIAMLLAYWKIENSRKASSERAWILVLGFIIGFSLFVWPSNCIAGGMILLLCLLSRKPPPSTKTWVKACLLLMGIALGILPSLVQGKYILRILSPGSLSLGSQYNVLRNASSLLIEALPASYAPWKSNGIAWQWTIYLIGIIAYCWAWVMLFSKRRSYDKTLLFFITCYPLLYAGIFVHCSLIKTSGYGPVLQARYLCPLVSSLLLANALMIHWAITSRYGILKLGGGVVLFVLIAFGVFSFSTVVTPLDIGYGTKEPGYFAQETGCRIVESYLDDGERLKVCLERVLEKPNKVVQNDIARGAAWLICTYRITDSNSQMINPRKFSRYIDIVQKYIPKRLQLIFKEEIGAYVFSKSRYDLKVSIDNLTEGLRREDAELSFIGLARLLPIWTKDPLRLRDAIELIPFKDKKALVYAMGQYFATGPDQRETINAIAARLDDKKSFLAGCNAPYGTRLYCDPSNCH